MTDIPTILADARSLLALQASKGARYTMLPNDRLQAILDAVPAPPDQDAPCPCTLCNLTVAEHHPGEPQ